jgi:hypothetical protein
MPKESICIKCTAVDYVHLNGRFFECTESCKDWVFSSSELKAQVSYSVRRLSVVRLSVRL